MNNEPTATRLDRLVRRIDWFLVLICFWVSMAFAAQLWIDVQRELQSIY